MFWKRRDAAKSEVAAGPKAIPELVQSFLIAERKIDPGLVRLLRAVVRKGPNGEGQSPIRIFDESETQARKVTVKDFASLDEYPDLIICEGWFDEATRRVELEEKRKPVSDTTIFTEAEIRQRIEALDKPGSTVFFYLAWGSGRGGPLGRGAAVVELNPNPGKKQKKYSMYVADVVDTQPVGKGASFLDSDTSEDIVRWIRDAHHKRSQ